MIFIYRMYCFMFRRFYGFNQKIFIVYEIINKDIGYKINRKKLVVFQVLRMYLLRGKLGNVCFLLQFVEIIYLGINFISKLKI